MSTTLLDLFDSLSRLLSYDPKAPMIFSSGIFLFLFAGFAFFYRFMRREVSLRTLYVSLFSLYFYYKTSGFFLFLLLFVAASDFLIGHYMAKQELQRRRKWLLTLSICIDIGLLVYFKYTNFFIGIINDLSGGGLLDFKNIFLPVGISFFVFQSISYTIDIYRRRIEPLEHALDYLFYLSFFPQLVAGPIVRARDFIPQIRQNPLIVTRKMYGMGIFLILSGLFKKAVISDYISLNFVDRVFDNPLLYSGFENLMGIYGYALQIYCDFSGYSDMAIGIALLLGFHFNQNFDSPYKSATITEFWRRWHISLSTWLKDYLYISLGGNRKGKLRTYFNLMITMLIGGLWHGAAFRFVGWGAWHGIGLAMHKGMMNRFPTLKATGMEMVRWQRILGIFITFNFVCIGWIMFRVENFSVARDMIMQIFFHFNVALIPQVMSGYSSVFLLMAIGYLLHLLPSRYENICSAGVIRLSPMLHFVLLALLIWGVMQIKSAEIQPFIYFQF